MNTKSKIFGGACEFSNLPQISSRFRPRRIIWCHHNTRSAKALYDSRMSNMSTAKNSHLPTNNSGKAHAKQLRYDTETRTVLSEGSELQANQLKNHRSRGNSGKSQTQTAKTLIIIYLSLITKSGLHCTQGLWRTHDPLLRLRAWRWTSFASVCVSAPSRSSGTECTPPGRSRFWEWSCIPEAGF